uniref:RNA helicase n=1 Tax=Calcidiscus leptoporus TaxID=127549 RepID=A0A7S0JBB2_9EUKA|mmetsp:Transcript_49364/g.114104  ORF Transcript_49364/g.114104 Transcript_49364/m.114104 type:complete len:471 (+) Transcript_49364:62-1474(+)
MASLSTHEYNATDDAIAGLTSQLAEEAGTQAEVEVAEEPTGLQEKDTDEVIDKTAHDDPLHSKTCLTFDDAELALTPLILQGLREMNFMRPSKIQAFSLPKIWSKRDLLAQSHNGTGKTACFVLGMLKAVMPTELGGRSELGPQALCLCPTRELAKQIAEEIFKMGRYLLEPAGIGVKTILREERYERGATLNEQIVVGTPGKVWTLINMRVLDTSKLKIFVLDEADEMLLLGGLGDTTKRIRQRLPKSVQTLFFSATWTDSIKKFAKQMSAVSSRDWSQIEVKRNYIFNDQVRQMFYRSKSEAEKEQQLIDVLNVVPVGQCVIFTNTRDAVERVGKKLMEVGHNVSMLHGRMEETARDKVIADFRGGATRFLVTTNVLARGVDIKAVTLVVQLDMPMKKGGQCDPETYLHRVGRTGRFGRPGAAVNMISSNDELKRMKQIEVYFSREGLIQEIPQDTDPEQFEALLKVT